MYAQQVRILATMLYNTPPLPTTSFAVDLLGTCLVWLTLISGKTPQTQTQYVHQRFTVWFCLVLIIALYPHTRRSMNSDIGETWSLYTDTSKPVVGYGANFDNTIIAHIGIRTSNLFLFTSTSTV
jgi:hypothetical protein